MFHPGLVTFSYNLLTEHIQELGLVIMSSDGFYANLSLPNKTIPNSFLGQKIYPLNTYLYFTLIID